jgi:hypothetical protein
MGHAASEGNGTGKGRVKRGGARGDNCTHYITPLHPTTYAVVTLVEF